MDPHRTRKAPSPPKSWRRNSEETRTQPTGGTSAASPALPTQNLSTDSQNGLFPYSQLKFALSNGVIYEKTHEVLSEVEDRLLEQLPGISAVNRGTHRLSEISPARLLNSSTIAHFANLFAAHRRTAQSRPYLRHLLPPTRRTRNRDPRYHPDPYLYIRLCQPLPKRSRRLYRSHREKSTQAERSLPPYSARLPIRNTLPLIVSRLSAGRGASASLPRSDHLRFSATHPSGVKAPQRPLTRLKEMRSDERFHSTPREKA